MKEYAVFDVRVRGAMGWLVVYGRGDEVEEHVLGNGVAGEAAGGITTVCRKMGGDARGGDQTCAIDGLVYHAGMGPPSILPHSIELAREAPTILSVTRATLVTFPDLTVPCGGFSPRNGASSEAPATQSLRAARYATIASSEAYEGPPLKERQHHGEPHKVPRPSYLSGKYQDFAACEWLK